jgi:hypothetical protein
VDAGAPVIDEKEKGGRNGGTTVLVPVGTTCGVADTGAVEGVEVARML